MVGHDATAGANLYGCLALNPSPRSVSPPRFRSIRWLRRRIVLATDIAESSLTVEGVRIVVDAGLARVPRYDVRTGMTRLRTVTASRSSADR